MLFKTVVSALTLWTRWPVVRALENGAGREGSSLEETMIRKILRSPLGIAGTLVFVFGVLLGLRYDPRQYQLQDTWSIADQQQRVQAMVENTQREKDRDMELAMILGSIAFGLLMLGSAAWKTRRPEQERSPG